MEQKLTTNIFFKLIIGCLLSIVILFFLLTLFYMKISNEPKTTCRTINGVSSCIGLEIINEKK
ncbi:MAG: hypothetical protein ACRCST_07490 [Turicibacter sp.]